MATSAKLGIEVHIRFGTRFRKIVGCNFYNSEFRGLFRAFPGARPPVAAGTAILPGDIGESPLQVNWEYGEGTTWYGFAVSLQNEASIDAFIREFENYGPELIRMLSRIVDEKADPSVGKIVRNLCPGSFRITKCILVQYPQGYPGRRELIESISWRRDTRWDRVRYFFGDKAQDILKSAGAFIPVVVLIGFGMSPAMKLAGTDLSWGELTAKFLFNSLWLGASTVVAVIIGLIFVAIPSDKEGLIRE